MSTKGTIILAAGIALSPLSLLPAVGIAHATPEEDSPSWSCVDDGNRVCGPGNPEGQPAGCYDDGGVLEFPWPCEPWTPDEGYRHADGTVTFPNGDVMTRDGVLIWSVAIVTVSTND